MMPLFWLPLLLYVVVIIGAIIGYASHAMRMRIRMTKAERHAEYTVEDAKRSADAMLREAKLEAKDEVIRAREKLETAMHVRRQELAVQENRLAQREDNMDRKLASLEKKDAALDVRLEQVTTQKEQNAQRALELEEQMTQINKRLEEVAHLSQDDAKGLLMARLEEELQGEAGALIRHVQESATENAEREARKIITMAIERYAANQVNDITTSTVLLPNDEMKGRIIGKEGRNIRSLEAATGVNFMIDDTPEVVVISGFDPMRREVAKQSLEKLISDGRINPARIEEVVVKVQSELEDTVRAAGEAAIYELGLLGVAPEIARTLGRLKFRHSYSQNVLKHSIEMAHLMAMMASELKLDPEIAKRAGLFHDIGKALDHDVEGSHAVIGADLLRRHGESPIVCNAVASHHGDEERESIYAALVVAADAMTASRPGARSETTELYVQRLENLEEIAANFRGVIKTFAIQAGRELRVLVEPSKIDDNEAMQMARNISKQIEHDLQYPGQIKVTVVRETRCVEYAK